MTRVEIQIIILQMTAENNKDIEIISFYCISIRESMYYLQALVDSCNSSPYHVPMPAYHGDMEDDDVVQCHRVRSIV